MRQYTQCTWKKYLIMCHELDKEMRIRDKRRVFAVMRMESVTHDHLLPNVGVTMGEFAFWQLMTETRRKGDATD